MVRGKQQSKPPPAAPGKAELRQLSGAERSAYFARREAAKVLRSVLQGDSRRQAVGSIKSLVYGPSVRNKKATFALVCETLKRLPIIKNVLESARVLSGKWKRQVELVYVVTYDVLFGQVNLMAGDVEKYIMIQKNALKSALEKLLLKKNVKSLDDLTALYQAPDVVKPRYVRVNTLKMDLKSAMRELEKQATVKRDDLIPELLILPPNTDLHDHPLITDGSLFMQGKGSCMVAAALNPQHDWKVLDACSAPGNKTVHLAALMKGKGKIIACELNKDRVLRLQQTVQLSGASNIQVLHGDFLKLNPSDPPYCKIRGILLDPSCSGSGTTADRLDHLLPSFGSADTDSDMGRLYKLAAFQKKALTHALSFPSVERVVYSTCSIHQIENEDVVESVLPFAESHGFHLSALFPGWPCRGLPTFEGSANLVRLDPIEDKEGFFMALFVRSGTDKPSELQQRDTVRGRTAVPCFFTKLSRMALIYPKLKKTEKKPFL